ncbi:MAG: hypothetical protein KDA17_05495 [Candidatus Saccharibacteria bacterium]|nr:hypothetical protein [Candidatus Saccharibacteria bacterium]
MKVKLNRTLFVRGIRYKPDEGGTEVPDAVIAAMLRDKSFPRGMCVLVERRWKNVYVVSKETNKAVLQVSVIQKAIDEAAAAFAVDEAAETAERESNAKKQLEEKKLAEAEKDEDETETSDKAEEETSPNSVKDLFS